MFVLPSGILRGALKFHIHTYIQGIEFESTWITSSKGIWMKWARAGHNVRSTIRLANKQKKNETRKESGQQAAELSFGWATRKKK